LVSVKLAVENGEGHVLEVRVYEPASVDTVPVDSVAVPASCPVHAGLAGTPPGSTVMV